MVSQPSSRRLKLAPAMGVMLLHTILIAGCGDQEGTLDSPTTDEIAAFIEANPEYAAKEQPTEEVRQNPKTGKEGTVAKPLDVGN